jgi:hypothetical protein
VAVTVATYGIGKVGGVAATMGYGFGVPAFVPVLPGKACVLIGTDPSSRRLVGTSPAAQRLIGTDPSSKKLVGPPECN